MYRLASVALAGLLAAALFQGSAQAQSVVYTTPTGTVYAPGSYYPNVYYPMASQVTTGTYYTPYYTQYYSTPMYSTYYSTYPTTTWYYPGYYGTTYRGWGGWGSGYRRWR